VRDRRGGGGKTYPNRSVVGRATAEKKAKSALFRALATQHSPAMRTSSDGTKGVERGKKGNHVLPKIRVPRTKEKSQTDINVKSR